MPYNTAIHHHNPWMHENTKNPSTEKIRNHEFWLNFLILTCIDGFVSHLCTFHQWLIATDYQCRQYCTPVKSEKSHWWKVHHHRAVPNRSWPNLLQNWSNMWHASRKVTTCVHIKTKTLKHRRLSRLDLIIGHFK